MFQLLLLIALLSILPIHIDAQYIQNKAVNSALLTKTGTAAAAYQVQVNAGTSPESPDQKFSYDSVNRRLTLMIGSTLYCITTSGAVSSDVTLEQCKPLTNTIESSQTWMILDVSSSDSFALQSHANADLCLDTKAGATTVNSVVSVNRCATNVATQQWFPSFFVCQPGQQPNSAFTGCETCPFDTFKDKAGYFPCKSCPSNAICPSASAGFKCDVGFARNAAADGCVECVLRQTYKNTISVGSCKPCPAGPGMICASTSALTCSTGYQWNVNRTNCELCPEAQIKQADGNTTCTACPAGQTSDGTRVSCVDCQDGYYRPNNTIVGCLKCPDNFSSCSTLDYTCKRGYGFNSTSQTCDKCPNGSVMSQQGKYTCIECQAGYQSNADNTQCTPCLDNQYRTLLSRSSCQTCPQYSTCFGTGFQCLQGYGWSGSACVLGLSGNSTGSGGNSSNTNNSSFSRPTVPLSSLLPKALPLLPSSFPSSCPENYAVNQTAGACVLSGYNGTVTLPEVISPFNANSCYTNYTYNVNTFLCNRQGVNSTNTQLPLVNPTFPCAFCDPPRCPNHYVAASSQICVLKGIGSLNGGSSLPALLPASPCPEGQVCNAPICPVGYQFNQTLIVCQQTVLGQVDLLNEKIPRIMPNIPCPPTVTCTQEVRCPWQYDVNSAGYCQARNNSQADNSISSPNTLPALFCPNCQNPLCYGGYVFSATQNLCIREATTAFRTTSTSTSSSSSRSQSPTETESALKSDPLKILSTPCNTAGCTTPTCPTGYHLGSDKSICEKDTTSPIPCQTGQVCTKPICADGFALNALQTGCEIIYRPPVACPEGITCTTPLCSVGYQYVPSQNSCGLISVMSALTASKSASSSAKPTETNTETASAKSVESGLNVGWILFIVLVSVIAIGIVSFFGWRKYRGRRQSTEIVQQDNLNRSRSNPIYSSQTNLNANLSRSASNNSNSGLSRSASNNNLNSGNLNRSSSGTFYGNR